MAPKGYLDVHCHFFPEISDEVASRLVTQLRTAHFMVKTPSQLHWSAGGIIDYNDHAGVAMGLLSYVPNSHEMLRQGNDYAHRIVEKYPSPIRSSTCTAYRRYGSLSERNSARARIRRAKAGRVLL